MIATNLNPAPPAPRTERIITREIGGAYLSAWLEDVLAELDRWRSNLPEWTD